MPETRSAKERREQTEKKLLEHEQDVNFSKQCKSADRVLKLGNPRNKPLESVSKCFIDPSNEPGSIKSEPILHNVHATHKKPLSSRDSKASSSRGSQKSSASKAAKRKQLLLEAAKQKAKIQMDIIDKTLEAQLAELSDEENLTEYSPQIDENHLSRRVVEEWVEHQSNHIEPQEEQQAPEIDHKTGELHQPVIASTPAAGPAAGAAAPGPEPAPAAPLLPQPDGTVAALNSAVQVLASALKDLTTVNVNNVPNACLLSRISTPKDLPDFSGDQLEWLQFKQAYKESTEVCKFTDRENLWRLRKCLRGPAKDAVAALFISASSPEKVMSTLELRFGNPDCIISRILLDLKKLQPLHHDYHKDIVTFAVKVQSFVEAVRAVGREEYLQGINIVSIILTKLPTVLLSKWSDYSYNLIKDGSQSRLLILSDFLHNEAVKMSTTAGILTVARNDFHKSTQNKYSENTTSRSQTVLVHAEESDKKCQFCRTSIHKLTDCKHFKRALRKVRWQFIKRNGLCYKCLISKHERETCQAPACDKDGCGELHHRLLHFAVKNNPERNNIPSESPSSAPSCLPSSSATTNVPIPRECEKTVANEVLTHINGCDKKVLLKVVPIRVYGPNGTFDSTALLDDGSSVSLISADLARRASLRGRTETLRVRGAFNGNELVCESSIVNVNLTGIDNKVHNIKMRCVSELNQPLQTLSILNTFTYSYLMDIKDDLCKSDAKPELLIGQDNHHLLMPLKIKFGNSNEPSATLTPLGWCVHGRVCMPQCDRQPKRHQLPVAHTNLFISENEYGNTNLDNESMWREIHEEVRRSFAIDSLGVAGPPRLHAEHERAVAQLERSAALEAGRWHVGLPWRDETCTLPDAFPSALKRLRGIEIKMGKNLDFAERYQERVTHLLENDYAKERTETGSTPKTWYLPHFGVDNPNKRKLRLVFDAASKVGGNCLNDYLLTGPDLLSSLLGIMLRFREHKVAVMGDIKDMFLRIKIRTEDQDALRFLWRDKPTGNIKTYVMTSLIFGANCSPFVAQFVKNKNARRYESSMPAAVNAICNSHYMDDYIDSLPDDTTAIEMVRNITEIHKAGGFEIRNWASNSMAVLESVPKETLGTAAVRFKFEQQYGSERTLGLIWFPSDDMLGFDVSLKRISENIVNGEERPTKRLMLKVIMSIFDVLGFLAPFTIQGRIMLQDTWRMNIGWDDYVPDDIYDRWRRWVDHLLKEIKNIRIPRCYKSAAQECDREGRSTHTHPSETQDAPSADAATPRPPSLSPPLACNAPTQRATSSYENVEPQHSATKVWDYSDLQLHIFCDASVQAMSTVGYWRWESNGYIHVAFISSKSRVMPLKQLTVPKAELQAALLAARLANTIEKEHKLAPVRRYFWCDSTTVIHWIRNSTRTYKAFEANRLGEIDQLTSVDEWRYVPTKLNVADLATRESFDQPLQGEWFTGPAFLYSDEALWPKDVVALEPHSVTLECVAVVQDETISLPVPDPQRFSSWLRLKRATAAVLKFIAMCKGQAGQIDCSTMERAEQLLLRHAQAESFSDEISCLKKGKSLHRNSKLISLSPILDENGALRANGRINAATGVGPDVKRPVILDGRHPVTRLIVRQCHERMAHDYQETVVNELKQTYWIIRLRPTVKFVVSRCMLCRIRKCKPQVPRMGDLPKARMAHHQRPFSHCGLDLFRPMEVTVGRRREKRYGALFTCLTVRAIHIELVASLTSDSLIMALRRMAARRGWPSHMYSDNGTNLRGADQELQRSMQILDNDVLKTAGINNGMVWSFIPPLSPHWGGAWERLIRSVKTSLRVVLNERAPRDEVLSTLMAEIENIVNSRPLMHVSVGPGEVESLTPNHFLLGSSSNLPIIGAFDNSDLYLLKHWRTAQKLADMYWQRWVREILPELIPRRKWHEEKKPLQAGDLVLVVDPNAPRNMWTKGVVTQVFPGRDGRVRSLELRTATGVWRRSAARVAPISLSDECCDQH